MSTTAAAAPIQAPAKATEKIRRALVGGHPLIYVQSWEESRVERLALHLARTFFGQPVPCGIWAVVDGLVVDGLPVVDTREPVKALAPALPVSRHGLRFFNGFPTAPGRRLVVRRPRDP